MVIFVIHLLQLMNFINTISLLLFSLLFITEAFSTHNKAGEITYKRLNGNTYEVTITTYTDMGNSGNGVDRCYLPVQWGDGRSDTLPRVNGPADSTCKHAGEKIPGTNYKINKYVGQHTYPGNGKYTISMGDPNRVHGIRNIPNSDKIVFYIQSTLIIHPLLGSNSSPELSFSPLDDACLCKGFYHNPGAVDPDGDSLSYALSVCYGAGGKPIPGYSFPIANCGNKIFQLDERTGTLTWDAPALTGVYNVCISIIEWRKRKGVQGPPVWDTVGKVLRDMQIDVAACNNRPPQFLPFKNLCSIAGDTIEEVITAYDLDLGNQITLTGIGEPIELRNSPATFSQPVTGRDTVKSTFKWATQCSHVRIGEYLMTFKAKDHDTPIPLANFQSLNIRVIAPEVENMKVITGKNKMTVTWDPSFCANIAGYDVYRKIDSSFWTPGTCETGIPGFLGYTKIGSTSGHTANLFVDDNNGVGLYHGLIYCYRVVTRFSDGSLSIASDEVCDKLPFNTPIINRNSVGSTDVKKGTDSLSFAKPKVINLTTYPPPYSYKIYSIESTTPKLVFTSPDYGAWNSIDTVVQIPELNTEQIQYSYKIELLSEEDQIGETHVASSTFLKIGPDDRRLHLSWSQNVPWANFEYVIFKEVRDTFRAIDTVKGLTYIDSGLVNQQEYRYYVKGLGKYSIDELPDTVINNSQIAVGIPKDTIPPCPPSKPSVKSQCKLFRNTISWNNPNNSCYYKDAVRYNLYYTPTIGGDYELLREIYDIDDTVVVFDELESVAGCYAVTAIDTFGNESELSTRACVDNCPIYELPNVFTPGGDGHNDRFTPIYPYRYVKDIDITIFNRWGQVMFETTDPDILWDGKRKDTQKQASSGVYFYICTVNEIRLSGIVPRELKGHITLLNEENPVPIE